MSFVINAAGVNGNRFDDTQVNQEKEGKQAKSGNRIYAGNLNITSDPIAQKRKEAQEKAMKVVKDAWENDRLIDESIDRRRAHIEEMRALEEEAGKHLDELEEKKSALTEKYGVPEDSDEYRDLQLLEKRQNSKAGMGEALTEEELERLKEIDEKPLTEYQQRSLELNAQALEDKKTMKNAKKQAMDDIANIQNIKTERLKTHGMVDAQKSSDAILEAANKEIIGMLIDEAKDSIDEKMEENEKKAEESAEAKKEEEEKLEDIKELREWQQAVIEGTKEAVDRAKAEERKNDAPDIDINEMLGMVKNNKQSDDVKQSLEEIKNSMRLVEADLKGIEVDVDI